MITLNLIIIAKLSTAKKSSAVTTFFPFSFTFCMHVCIYDHQCNVFTQQEIHNMRAEIAAQGELIKIMEEHVKLHKNHQATASATDREM